MTTGHGTRPTYDESTRMVAEGGQGTDGGKHREVGKQRTCPNGERRERENKQHCYLEGTN